MSLREGVKIGSSNMPSGKGNRVVAHALTLPFTKKPNRTYESSFREYTVVGGRFSVPNTEHKVLEVPYPVTSRLRLTACYESSI